MPQADENAWLRERFSNSTYAVMFDDDVSGREKIGCWACPSTAGGVYGTRADRRDEPSMKQRAGDKAGVAGAVAVKEMCLSPTRSILVNKEWSRRCRYLEGVADPWRAIRGCYLCT
jgi:hypothetical protein